MCFLLLRGTWTHDEVSEHPRGFHVTQWLSLKFNTASNKGTSFKISFKDVESIADSQTLSHSRWVRVGTDEETVSSYLGGLK